jgi:hypothetical protein
VTIAASPTPLDEVLVAVTRTGEVVGQLPWETWSYSEALAWSDPGKATVTVPLRDRRGSPIATGTRELLWSIRRFPWTYSVVIVRDQRALWAGPGLTVGRSGGTVTVGCVSITKLFDRRWVIQDPYYGDPTNALGNIHLELSTRDLVIELITRGSTGFRRDLPLDLPDQLGDGGIAVDYVAADLGTVTERVKEAVDRDDGPDVLITPQLDLDQRYLRWTVDVGNPRLGSTTSAATFDGAITDITDDVDGTEMVSTAAVVGDASGDDARLIGISVVDRGDPHPALEGADQTSVSERRPEALAALARSYGEAYAQAPETLTFTVDADSRPRWQEDYSYGDVATYTVNGDDWLPDGDYVRRIISVEQDQDSISHGTVPAEVP